MNPKIKWKKRYKKCAICDSDNYHILDVHRIKPGALDGQYVLNNILVVCANDHRRIHSGEIEIIQLAQSTSGQLLIYKEFGEEFIKLI